MSKPLYVVGYSSVEEINSKGPRKGGIDGV
jgi:hypothetical protein